MDFHEAYTDRCSSIGMAARHGTVDTLEQLIEIGRAVDVKDNRGWMPLHEAAYHGNTDCLALLLKLEGVDINMKSYEGETALFIACRRGKGDCVKKLLEEGANKNLPTNELISPLFEACYHGHMECVSLLLEDDCDVNHHVYTGDTALHTAVEHNYLGIVKMLLQHKADVSAVSEHNLTPVFIAAQFGKAECLQELLTEARIQEKQDVVNITANDNASPLLIACQNGHRNCVQMLLQNGADPLLKVELDGEDNTMDSLQYAVKFGHHGCLKLLLELSKIDPQSYTPNKFHPLILAIQHKETSCLQMLHKKGFKLDQTFYRLEVQPHPLYATGTIKWAGYGCILCFSPTYEAVQYILQTGFEIPRWNSLSKPDRTEMPSIVMALNPIIRSLEDPRVTDLLLQHGAVIDDTKEFWEKTFANMDKGDSDTIQIVTNTCFMYILIKHGCNLNTAIDTSFHGYANFDCVNTPEEGMFNMMFMLQTNINQPDWGWGGLEHMADEGLMSYNIEIPLLCKIEEDSDSLMHACRVSVARRMISVDKWNSKNVEKLTLPKILLDYLQFKEYGRMGTVFMGIFPLIQDYLGGKLSDKEVSEQFERLTGWSRPQSPESGTSSDDEYSMSSPHSRASSQSRSPAANSRSSTLCTDDLDCPDDLDCANDLERSSTQSRSSAMSSEEESKQSD